MKPIKSTVQLLRNYNIYFYLTCLALIFIQCESKITTGWLTYRHDNARSGVIDENMTSPLLLRWTFKPTHAPKPAWPEPGEEMARTHFDNAYHVTVANDIVYFGSSVDNKVYALNENNGNIKWTFFTEGPVRFAPTIFINRLYVGSDDGYVYCLKLNTGKPVWKYRVGPSDEKVLGNGRMISLWPVRTSILVDDGIVYFGAGVFPYEGIYICALDADDGSVVWKNDTIGDRAHELAFGGISPQSYLVASENILYVPSGRAMPAAFDKTNGNFLYYCLPGGKVGGTWLLLDKENVIAGVDWSGTPAKVTYDQETGKKMEDAHAWFPGVDLVVTPEVSYTATENGIFAMNRVEFQTAVEKVTDLKEETQQLRSKIKDVEKKLQNAVDTTRNKLTQQWGDLSKKINKLADSEKQLKDSVKKWECPAKNLNSLILAGDKLFAGGDGIVLAVDAQTGEQLWKTNVEGKVCGLAASNGNLFISTDNGNIYCFGESEITVPKEVKSIINPSPYKKDKLTEIYELTADNIIQETGIKKGYCLVLGAGTGRLAFELAKRTDLQIICIEKDQKKINAAKKSLDAAGLYGSRVVVENWDLSSLPNYFANLIVSDEILTSGKISGSSKEMYRVLKPLGGVAYLGQSTEATENLKSLNLDNLLEWLRTSGGPEPEVIKQDGLWAKVTRGTLEDTGSWTEQYANPQNTACSNDQLVKGPLGVLWFGEPGPKKMLDRHAKAGSPVSINGRLFIQGEEVVMAYDAYNGTHLWETKIPGAVRPRADIDGGNLSATEHGLYVAAFDKCYCLHPSSGEIMQTFEVPLSQETKSHRWGCVSCTNNILYGSRAMPLNRGYFDLFETVVDNGKWANIDNVPPQYRNGFEDLISKYPVPDEKLLANLKRSGALWRGMADFPVWELYKNSQGAVTDKMMVSDMIFAMNPDTGKLLWKHHGNRIAHITIAIGDGIIVFAESSISREEKNSAINLKTELIKKGIYEESKEGEIPDEDTDVRIIICLDAVTGKKLWEKPYDFTGCGGDGMGAAYHDGVLLFFGNTGTHDAWRFKNGSLFWRRVTAISAKNGDMLWSRPLNYNTRPVIVDDQIFIEPRACDLYTGEIKMRSHPITGKQVPFEYLRPGHTCAISSASANLLFYRSYCTAIYDFEKDRGLTLFGGIRPGCWINMIPANGVLLFPDASAGCTCSFPLRCSLALTHKPDRSQPYTVFIAHGAMSTAKHFAINLGAPADMKDEEGVVWFAYPNPNTDYLGNHYPDYGVKFDLKDEFLEGMGYFSSDFKNTAIEGSQKPWLFTSGCMGFSRCEIPLIDDLFGEEPGIYTVRLGFSAPPSDRIGQRIFDMMLQGKPVLKNFDICKEAGTTNKAIIKEFNGIKVENILTLVFSSEQENPTIAEAPLINFIEVIREDAAEISVEHKYVPPITNIEAKSLLTSAESELNKKNLEKALEKYHTVLDAAPTVELKKDALEGMANIQSPESLTKLARYCRDLDPILWNYRAPDTELKNSATKVYIGIANNIARSDKQRAIRMLNHALTITSQDTRKQVVTSLQTLGIDVIDETDK
ncbi:MAG: PQQ-binding-like beta-propeller repeat protein [bacterium]|nr:MAG: PQQ-binding-like beta-propeller repeat protein [bacterium]